MALTSMPANFGLSLPSSIYNTPNLLFDQSHAAFYHVERHSDKPEFWHLVGLVCEAVLEVVCVSGLGFIAARRGLFPAKVQKDVANLNIYFFTPCLIFSKLSSQLTADKLRELWIIPVILFVQTVISWLSALLCTKIVRIKKLPHRNFVTAMAVFGNSNSLPLSLVISLSHTISGLHWDQVPGDNDEEVGARGILYLLVFSQLGQAVRWSWGMNTLLRPMNEYTPAERGELPRDEEEHEPYRDDDSDSEDTRPGSSDDLSSRSSVSEVDAVQIKTDDFTASSGREEEPLANGNLTNRSNNLAVPGLLDNAKSSRSPLVSAAASAAQSTVDLTQHAAHEAQKEGEKIYTRVLAFFRKVWNSITTSVSSICRSIFSTLPGGLQKFLSAVWHWVSLVVIKTWGCLNVPLMAIIVAVLVGSIPALKAFFYTRGTFVNNTVTSAVNQLAGVAVPLILFVLGGNLCKSTLPGEDLGNEDYRKEKKRMLFSAIACRMLFPLLFMAPLLALMAKFTPISILDDPIFIIVCFLLTGAPSALQLAQICQVNDVFVPVISDLLLYSYVVLIFPSTIILVMLALEVVKWATD